MIPDQYATLSHFIQESDRVATDMYSHQWVAHYCLYHADQAGVDDPLQAARNVLAIFEQHLA